MSTGSPDLVLSTAPFLKAATSTPRIMREVLVVALLVLLAACWNFGISALVVVAAASAGAAGCEWAFTRAESPSPLRDYSAATTGFQLMARVRSIKKHIGRRSSARRSPVTISL